MNSDQMFERVCKIADRSGLGKLRFLTPDMGRYLVAAYDPYKRYYMRLFETPKSIGQGTNQFDGETWDILNNLSTRLLSGDLAKSIVKAHLQQLTPDSSRLFIRIINKDLRFGLGAKSINKALPKLIPTHDVMLAKIFEIKRVLFPCYISPKVDGVRAVFKNGEFYSRNGHIYPGLAILKQHVRDMFGGEEPPVLDGELTVKGVDFQTGSGLIRKGLETPDAHYSIFEIPESPSTFTGRVMQMMDLQGLTPFVSVIPHDIMTNMDELMGYYFNCRQSGYEGAVVKPYDYEYVGSRSYRWMKMKNTLSADVVVTDIVEGKGKYVGQLGAVIVDFHNVSVSVGSGFSDDERILYFKHPELIVGHIIEVLYMEETPDGSMRHPRFLTLRPDKE